MGNDSNPKKLSGTATTAFGSVFLFGISINKALAGTLTVNEGASAVGQFAISTTPGDYHNCPSGVRYSNLTIVLSAGDDVTVFTKTA